MDQPASLENSIRSDDAQVSRENERASSSELTPLDSEVMHQVAGGDNGTIIIER
jgi:hypothetical protein